MSLDVYVDERALRELYLPAFETAVVKSRPWTVMCAAYYRYRLEHVQTHHSGEVQSADDICNQRMILRAQVRV